MSARRVSRPAAPEPVFLGVEGQETLHPIQTKLDAKMKIAIASDHAGFEYKEMIERLTR